MAGVSKIRFHTLWPSDSNSEFLSREVNPNRGKKKCIHKELPQEETSRSSLNIQI